MNFFPGSVAFHFIFMTALADRKLERQARCLGADSYITKPLDFEILETTIKARLALAAANAMQPKARHVQRSRG